MSAELPLKFEASDADGLMQLLDNLELTTHPAGRSTKYARELWVLRKFLPHLVNCQQDGPSKLVKSEHPDFILGTAEKSVGVEIAEAVPQSLAAFRARSTEIVYTPTPFFRHPSGKEAKAAAEQATDIANGPPIFGNEIERLLCKLLVALITKKRNNLLGSHYAYCVNQHLVIYDSGSPAGTDLNLVKSMVREELPEDSRFDAVWLISESHCNKLLG